MGKTILSLLSAISLWTESGFGLRGCSGVGVKIQSVMERVCVVGQYLIKVGIMTHKIMRWITVAIATPKFLTFIRQSKDFDRHSFEK